MFALLLHESTNTFHYIATSFPTVIYTVILGICIIYWLFAALGLVDIEILDMDLDGDIDGSDSTAAQSGIAGLLSKFGLNGVPMTIVLSLLSLIGWIFSYYAIYFGAKILPSTGIIILSFKLIVFLISIFVCVFITAQILKPIRKAFNRLEADETKYIVGQVVTVRSGIVNNDTGEAMLHYGGADILLNIRTTGSEEFSKGDEVVVIEEINDLNLYRVISKNEFEGINI